MEPGEPITGLTASIPTPEQEKKLVRIWQERAPKKYKALLAAVAVGSAVESEWYYDVATQSYVSSGGDPVQKATIKYLYLSMFIGMLGAPAKETGIITWEGLATSLKNAEISIAEWQQGMATLITERQEVAMLLANGGENFVTLSDWQFVQAKTQEQLAYLEKFAKDVADNPEKWLNGRLDARMDLYRESGYASLQDYWRQQAIEDGMEEERRVLGVADHCDGCLDQAALGWQPIGTLDAIGDEECNMHCRCEFEYRKAGDGEQATNS